MTSSGDIYKIIYENSRSGMINLSKRERDEPPNALFQLVAAVESARQMTWHDVLEKQNETWQRNHAKRRRVAPVQEHKSIEPSSVRYNPVEDLKKMRQLTSSRERERRRKETELANLQLMGELNVARDKLARCKDELRAARAHVKKLLMRVEELEKGTVASGSAKVIIDLT